MNKTEGPMVIDLCRKSNVKELKSFIKKEWSSSHVLAHDNEVLDWFYANDDETYNFVIAIENEEIHGVLGFIPNSRFDKSLYENDTFWLALWKVRSSQEKNLLGLKLVHFLSKNFKFACIAVNGINMNHPKMYRALGYQCDSLNHYVFFNFELRQNIALNVNARMVNKSALDSHDLNVQEIDNSNYRNFVSYFVNLESKKTLLYLINKYAVNKFYDYKVLYVSNDDYKALFVLKVVTINARRVLRIVDFLGDTEIIAYSHKTLTTWLVKYEVEYIDFLNFGIDSETMAKSGFILKSCYKELIVPNYFEPFVAKNKDIYFAYKTKQMQGMVICKGDGDQERPNQLRQNL